MTGHDAEPTLSTTGEQGTGMEQRWDQRRQRAADLFSPHRYRALQVSLFERMSGRSGAEGQPTRVSDRFAPVPMTGAVPVAPAPVPHVHQAAPLSDGAAALESLAGASDLASLDDEGATAELAYAAAPAPQAEGVAEEGAAWVSSNGEWPVEPAVSWDEVPASGDSADAPAAPAPGRNLRTATVVGVILLIVAVLGAWLHPLVFAVLLYAFACGAVVEWKRALERHGRNVPLVPLLAATVGMGVATWFAKPEGLVVALLVGCAGVVAWRIGDERMENTLADSLAGILTLLWIPFLASFLFLLEIADDGWQRVVIIVLAVVGNDTGGLIAGMTLGRHKLLPRVSPAKTWEGAAGGVLLGTAAASVAAYLFFDGEWFIGAAVGAAAAIAAIIGDLAESALKRDIRLKDMSSAIPGHGGILDRIDSLLFAAPVGYVVFAIFLGTLGGGGL